MAPNSKRVRIKRSTLARLFNGGLAVLFPAIAAVYVGATASIHHESSFMVGAVIGSIVGGAGALAYWWDRAATIYHLRGSTLRAWGRDGGSIDLAQVKFAKVVRQERPRGKPSESLGLMLENADFSSMTVKIGDRWIRRELCAASLLAIAERLDRPSAAPSVLQVAGWLRRYAHEASLESWPAAPAAR